VLEDGGARWFSTHVTAVRMAEFFAFVSGDCSAEAIAELTATGAS
jgi:hypothetical protein